MELHKPVLLNETINILQPKPGENYLDLTAGYGGHAKEFLSITGNYNESVLVDRDDYAVSHLSCFAAKGATVVHSDFYHAAQKLVEDGNTFSLILMDLGVSSPQLDNPDRGFSFSNAGPLDMRMDRQQELTADTVVNHWSEDKLTDIFTRYGEEKLAFSKTIASNIVQGRPVKTTLQLAELIKSKSRYKYSKTHPATRFFQAIRIAVNDELSELSDTLKLITKLLKSGGRVGIISFHSLEDRIVKDFFKSESSLGLESELQILTKKPLSGEIYDVNNPRARSAKLRAAVKINK